MIAAVLADAELQQFLEIAQEIGLDCIVEVHSLPELKRVQKLPAEIIGLNNRDLTTFKTSMAKTFVLCVPLNGYILVKARLMF